VRESYDTVVISHSPRREEPLYAEAHLTRYTVSSASPDAHRPAPCAMAPSGRAWRVARMHCIAWVAKAGGPTHHGAPTGL